jgi:hypothetical protein
MNKTSTAIKSIISNVAPVIGTALGSPLIGAAIAAISTALFGNPNATPDKILKDLNVNTEECLVKLQQADNDFKIKIQQLDIDLEKLSYDDKADARSMNEKAFKASFLNRNITPILALLITFGFFSTMVALMFVNIDADAKGSVDILSGALGMAFSIILGFYFGSSIGSLNNR